MFRGRFDHAVDAKGRTSLPSRFREAVTSLGAANLVITTGLDSCLIAYPLHEWQAFEEKVGRLPQFDPSAALLRRLVVSAATDCEIDKLGRVPLAPSLREHACIGKKVVWAGMGKYIEIWAKDLFDSMCASALEDPQLRAELARRATELGL